MVNQQVVKKLGLGTKSLIVFILRTDIKRSDLKTLTLDSDLLTIFKET